jgi:hypothetical protein
MRDSEAITRIAAKEHDSNSAWDEWIAWMRANAKGVTEIEKDYSYLRSRFGSFHDFALLIGMLRASSVESFSNKRWTSKFVFPFGPSALYVDLNLSGASGRAVREYINFGRTGEILYMMLCRSTRKAELKRYVEALVTGNNQWNRLTSLLQPGSDNEDRDVSGKSCYLPYRAHGSFND